MTDSRLLGMETKPQPLRRLPRDEEGMPRYLHLSGYVIVKGKRSWSERVGAMRGQAGAGPMWWWDVFPHAGRRADALDRLHPWARLSDSVGTFDRLTEAREWCDENPRWFATEGPQDG